MLKPPRTVCGGIFQIPIPLGSIKCLDESNSPLFFESSKISEIFDGRSWNQLVNKIIQTRSDMSGCIENFHSIPDALDSNIDKEIKIIDNAIGPTFLYMSYIRLLEFVLSRNIPVIKTHSFPNGLFFQSYWTSPIKEKKPDSEAWTVYTTQSLHAEMQMCFLTLALLYHTLGVVKLGKKDKKHTDEVSSNYYTSMMICKTALSQYKIRTHVKMLDIEQYDPIQNIILNEHQLLVFIELVYKLAHMAIVAANIKNTRNDDIEKHFPESDVLRWIRRDIQYNVGAYVTIGEGGYKRVITYQKLHLSVVSQVINILSFLRQETIVSIHNIYDLVENAMNSLMIYTFIEFLKNLNFIIYDEEKPDTCYIVYTKYDDLKERDVTVSINVIHGFLNFMMNFIISLATSFCSRKEILHLNNKMKNIMFIVTQITHPIINNNNKCEILEDPMIPNDLMESNMFDIPIDIPKELEPIMKTKLEHMIDFLKNSKSMNTCIHLLLYNSFPA
jgi:hypothetical protein